MRKVEFRLETLTCPTCIKKIETALSRQTGVQDARVLFQASKVKATIDEKVVTPQQLAAVIENLGYPVLTTKVA